MLVSELMSSPVVSCPAGATLGEVAALLAERRIHGVVVRDDAGEGVGVVSDTDLLAGEWLATDPERLEAMRTLTAGELMTTPAVTIEADAPAAEAAALLRQQRLARVLVTRDGEPVGVLAVSDLVRRLGVGESGRGTVADVMSRGIVVCREGTTAHQAARAMTERRSRSLVVVAGDGRALGVVTGHDLLALAAWGDEAGSRRIEELMHEPITVKPTATLREAADLMLAHEIHRLVVVDPAAPRSLPLGLVSTADIVAEMAGPGSVWA